MPPCSATNKIKWNPLWAPDLCVVYRREAEGPSISEKSFRFFSDLAVTRSSTPGNEIPYFFVEPNCLFDIGRSFQYGYLEVEKPLFYPIA